MARPGFVLEVDEHTPPLLCLAGTQVRLHSFDTGTHVVYPPDAVASKDPIPMIDAALATPVSGPALADLLDPGTKLVVIVAADHVLTPRMRFDVRRALLERVLEVAAHQGVGEIHVVVAGGLHRRWSTAEIAATLGNRVASSLLPEGLISTHDVESDDLEPIGDIEGTQVRINRHVAQADVVVEVGVIAAPQTRCGLATSITDVGTIATVLGVHGSQSHVAAVNTSLCQRSIHFTALAVVGQPLLSPALSFVNRREWEWRPMDHVTFAGGRQLVTALPRRGAQALFGTARADYQLLDVVAGKPEQVHREAGEVWQAGNSAGPVPQADVVIASAWGPDMVDEECVGNPVAALNHVVAEKVGNSGGRPFVRPSGVIIGLHPLTRRSSRPARGGALDFLSSVLPHTKDPELISQRFESVARSNEWMIGLYRKGHADHPLRVFHAWYRSAAVLDDVAEMIWVGADRTVVDTFGHRCASTIYDALELASTAVGQEPSITYLRSPGRVLGLVS